MEKVLTIGLALLLSIAPAFSRDDGRYADEPLHAWFDKLANHKGGLCCSFADGYSIQDVDWDTSGDLACDKVGNTTEELCHSHYRVRINGEWVTVPDDAVVTEPNKFGPAVVWPYMDSSGTTQIRCFLPGAGT